LHNTNNYRGPSSQHTFCNCIQDTYGHKIKPVHGTRTLQVVRHWVSGTWEPHTPHYEDGYVRNDYQAMRRDIPEDRRPQISLLGLSALYTRRFTDQLKITLFPARFAIHNIRCIKSRLLQQSNTNHNIPLPAQ
jgi:hypothetical protein